MILVMDEADLQKEIAVFEKLDADNDGFISRKELE